MNINKILFLFLGAMTLLIFGLWQIAHTEKFAIFLSSKLKTTLLKNFNGNVSFDSIEIGVFPLATKVKNFSLETTNDSKNNIYFKFDEVGFYFSPMDLLSSKLSIDKMVLKSGFLKCKNENSFSNTSDSNFKIEKIFSYYESTGVGKMLQMIRTIRIENANLCNGIDVDDVKMQTYSNYIVLAGNFREINVAKLVKKLDRKYENIKFYLEVGRQDIRIKSFEMRDELETVTFKGDIKELGKGHAIRGELQYQGRLKKMLQWVKAEFPKNDEFSGYIDVNVNVSGNIKELDFKVDFQGDQIETPYFIADDISGSFDVLSDKVIVNKAELKKGLGVVSLLDAVEIFDIKNTKIIPDNARFQVNDLFSNDVSKAVNFLDIAKGRISGVVEVAWTTENVIIKPYDGLYFKKFKIHLDGEKVPILKNEKMTFHRGEFVIERDGRVLLDFDISFPGCRFQGKGSVGKEGIDVLVDNGTVDFLGLGEVGGVQIEGKGDFKMHVVGLPEDVWFNFDVDLDDFKISEYKFKNIVGDINFSLKNKSLYLNDIRSEQEISRLRGKGELSLNDGIQLNLNIKAEKLSLEESYFSAAPIFNPLKKKLKNVKMRYGGSVSLKIDFEDDKVEASGNIYTEEISLYVNEYVDVLYGEFVYRNKKIIFDNVEVRKGDGKLTGKLEIDIEKDFFKYRAKLFNLNIRDIYLYRLSNLEYKARLFGESYGEGTPKRYRTQTNLEAKQGYIGKKKVKDGKVTVSLNQNNLKMEGSLLGDIVRFESNINLRGKKSYFKGEVNTPEIGILAGLVSKRNIFNESIQGEAKFIWDISVDMSSFKIIGIDFDLKKFSFKYDQLALNLVGGRDRIIVENGEIKKWDIGIIGKDNFIISMGRGNLSGDFEIKQEFKLNALVAMLLSSRIDNVYGDLQGSHAVSWKNNKFRNDILLESKDIFLKIKGLADSFSKTKFRISMVENKAVMENFSTVFGDGMIKGDGHIVLSTPYPVIDINFKMENSKISFFRKSRVVASSDFYLKGKKLPYVIGGEVSILHGDIKDELKDILKNFSTFKNYNKYAPQRSNNNVFRYLNYDLDVNISNPVAFSNSLVDVRIEGGGRVSGNLDSPLLDGEFNTVKGVSRIMFKNHDFIISEGSLAFNDTSENKVPLIKLVGTVDVDDYNIKLNVFGDVESTQIELSSVPSLPQQDILSLLALGITTNMDKDLNEKDRQSITTLGFGSLVVEQLKLHEGLTSSLGLRLSVQPEFQENNSSPLEGRIDNKESSEKIKTATKVKVQKKISDNMDLSLSSTLGDAVEQRQIMNIIYKVNKNLSLEGIYEINSSDIKADESLNSGGIDIKYRISF